MPTPDAPVPGRRPRRPLGRGPGAARPSTGGDGAAPRVPASRPGDGDPGATRPEPAGQPAGGPATSPSGTAAETGTAPREAAERSRAPRPTPTPDDGRTTGEDRTPGGGTPAEGASEGTPALTSTPREDAAPGGDAPSDGTPRGDAVPTVSPETDEVAPDPQVTGDHPTGDHPAGDPADPQATEDGRFTVVLDNFEGPFDLLLQLIAKHKLDVTEVALSKVTDEFMAHIHAMGPDWDLDQATEFLVVAATLLDLKAARLLPAAELEDEEDLALLEARDLLFARLLQYRAYKQIAEILAERLAAEALRHPRTVGLEPHHADLLPEVVIKVGPEGFAKLAVKAMQPKPKPRVYVDHIHAPLVSVREQAQVVVGRLRELGEADFARLVADAPDTLTVVARFLALLELYRERAIVLEQEEALGPLTVRWSGGETEQPYVTDEFDQVDREAGAAAEEPA